MMMVMNAPVEPSMLERESLGTWWYRLRNWQGEMLYRSLGAGSALIIGARYLGDEFLPQLIAQLELELARAPRVALYLDASGVTGFGAAIRQGLADWLVHNRHRADGRLLVGKKSAVVELAARMTARVAGECLRVMWERSEFEAPFQGVSKAA